ncbi:Fur-regulated basic protein FbpA [Geomicrobium sp. JCM 19038]|nr:Fur-regulated basic protein FbpA [Geomicrobium sp. JCM 19038]
MTQFDQGMNKDSLMKELLELEVYKVDGKQLYELTTEQLDAAYKEHLSI